MLNQWLISLILDVKDSNNIRGSAFDIRGLGVKNSGNNANWTIDGVTLTETSGSTAVSELGTTTDTYGVVLASEPSNSVTVTVNDSNPDVSATDTLTFTTGNWNTPQNVTVTAVDDDIYELAHTASLTHSASSSDSNYSGISINNITANITDDELKPVVTLSLSSPTLDENGETTTTVTATQSRQSDFTTTVSYSYSGTATDTDDYNGAGSTTIAALSLSSSGTDITAVDDLIDDDNETIIVNISDVTNGSYSAPQQVTATISDNDIASFTSDRNFSWNNSR